MASHVSEIGSKAHATSTTQNDPLLDSASREKDLSSSWLRWRAFMTIAAFLAHGVVGAVGHHILNSHLNGKPVANLSVSQSWIFRFGTGFAFLVKMAFAVSVSASYVQYQWYKLRRQSFRVDEIDSLTDVLENVTRFFYSFVFLRQPVLLFIAIVVWLIPFAAVVTPGTLTVGPAQNITTVYSQVPQADFSSPSFGNVGGGGGKGNIATTALIYKLAYNVAAAGQAVALTSEHQNETYNLVFNGPAVQCMSANESMIRNQTLTYGLGDNHAPSFYEYVSWVPGDTPSQSFTNLDITLDQLSADVSRIFVTSNTGSWNKTLNVPEEGLGNSTFDIGDIVVIVTECRLYNATYNANFTFQYPNQTYHIYISNWLNPVAAANLGGPNPSNTLGTTTAEVISYSSMMQAFGKLLQIMNIDWSDGSAIQSGLESMFQNFTISLLTSEELLKPQNETTPVPITFTTYPITYIYAKYELLAAYGLAFSFALICAVIGTYASFINHASYQNTFSSFLRAASGREGNAMFDANSNGTDPLPPSEARIRLTLSPRNGNYR